jgi:GntR family transcriptional regulator
VTKRATAVERLRDELLAELLDGTYPAGEKLPNEDELAERSGVSRATVREAVGGLVEAGYLTRRHGSGTYVAGTLPRRHALDMSVSYRSMIRAAGMEPGLRIIDQAERGADQEEAEALKVEVGAPLLRVERVRTGDGRPVVYSVDRFPIGYAPDAGELNPSLYAVLDEAGHAVRGGSAKIKPVVSDDSIASHLEIEVGTPLLRIDQLDFDADGTPVMVSAEWHIADAFELHINRRAAQSARLADDEHA